MANGYGGSSGSSGSASSRTTTTTSAQRTAVGRPPAPPGFHYMPDGTLMSDAEHMMLYGQDPSLATSKVIKSFDLDLSDLPASVETRNFTIVGDKDAEFILEIKNEDSYYYNFTTNAFQVAQSRLEETILTSSYNGSIRFPAISDDDQYDIYLYAKPGTTHTPYVEARFGDETLDINNSVGSNSLMMQKVIYQYTDLTLTISPNSPNSVTDLIKSSTRVDNAISVPRLKSKGKVPFRLSCETNAATKSYEIKRQPTPQDVFSLLSLTVDATPEILPGEDEYPTVRADFTGDDTAAALTSGSVVRMANTDLSAVIAVGDKITSPTTTGNVNGAIADGDKIVLDENVASIMSVGDQVLGCAACGTSIIVVKTLNPDTDNVKEFEIELEGGGDASTAFTDDERLTFSSKVNRKHTTVTVVETSSTATDFTMSNAIQFREAQELNFTPRANFQWPVNNITNVTKGLELLPGTNIVSDSVTSDYEDSIVLFEGTEQEETVIKNRASYKDAKDSTPTVVKGVVTTQAGNIVFNKQQSLAFGGATRYLLGYGATNVLNAYGYDVIITDLKVSLNDIKTTTTAAVSNSATIPVASVNGILPNVSTISGIGIDASKADPTITARSATSGAGNLTASAAQTLESGQEFTFSGAGQIATITGNIEILRSGTANQTIYIDVEKLLSIT